MQRLSFKELLKETSESKRETTEQIVALGRCMLYM